MLGESNRLSGRSLPVDVELHVRAEERYLPDEKKLEEIVHDPSNLPAPSPRRDPSEPVFSFAPVAEAQPEPVDAVLAYAAPAAVAEPEPVGEAEPDIDLTTEDAPEPALDLTNDTVTELPAREMSDPRARNRAGRRCPPGARPPLEGNLNEMVDELHRKAREDSENHRTR